MTTRAVAVVTGSNKGIGFAIVRGLCKQFQGDVYLTSRDEGRGEAAVKALKNEGLQPKFHQLDIDSHSSIQKLHDFLKENYGGLDILVNNAGIAYKNSSPAPFSEQAEMTVKTNFWGNLAACEVLFPLLRPHARVVTVSSTLGHLSLSKMSPEKQALVHGVKTIADIKKLMTEFVEDAKAGNHLEKGWSNSAYGMSKVGRTAVTFMQQTEMDAHGTADVVINACSPGHVQTDMSSYGGDSTIDQGAETPLYLALLPKDVQEPRGKFVKDKKVVDCYYDVEFAINKN